LDWIAKWNVISVHTGAQKCIAERKDGLKTSKTAICWQTSTRENTDFAIADCTAITPSIACHAIEEQVVALGRSLRTRRYKSQSLLSLRSWQPTRRPGLCERPSANAGTPARRSSANYMGFRRPRAASPTYSSRGWKFAEAALRLGTRWKPRVSILKARQRRLRGHIEPRNRIRRAHLVHRVDLNNRPSRWRRHNRSRWRRPLGKKDSRNEWSTLPACRGSRKQPTCWRSVRSDVPLLSTARHHHRRSPDAGRIPTSPAWRKSLETTNTLSRW